MPYTTEYRQAGATTAELLARHRDTDRFSALCSKCPGFEASWLCPPVDAALSARIDDSDEAVIVGVRITPAHDCSLSASELMQSARIELEKRLLELEKTTGGLACGLSGRCTYCGHLECARKEGLPCRHPDLARPSLEAHGFDVTSISRQYLDTPVLWPDGDKHPPYYTLVGAVFFRNNGQPANR